MANPGNSIVQLLAYWSGDPTNVSTSELNIPQFTMVIDLGAGVIRQKTSSTDNSAFVVLATTTGAQTPSSILSSGSIESSSPSAGLGYATGAGGAITQITSVVTGVTLNKITGQVTTVALSLAAAASATFTVTDSACGATDIPVVSSVYAGAGTLVVGTKNVVAGAFDIVLFNAHATAALNALAVVNFAIVKGSAS